MGVETEYGIVVPGNPAANPMVASGDVVTAYAASRGIRPARASWDYADEAPLRDARGFDMGRGLAHPSQLTDVEDPTLANVVLTNGARLYVDHAHPEYSSPEVTSPRAAVTWDRAGELVMREAVNRLATVPPGVNLYKNNTDGKGASYGTHENYLMARSTPFASIVRHLTPFFVVRQVMCGSGRVGIGVDSRTAGYQIAQRSDFFEVEVGLETTLKRPIINTRDEPHAVADRYRRLHVILGDANHCDVANLLKMGTTSLVLAMIEADALRDDLSVRRPVATLQEVSHDLTLQGKVELADGRRMTALELLWEYHDRAARFVAERSGNAPDPDTAEVMHWWGTVLDHLVRTRWRLAGRSTGWPSSRCSRATGTGTAWAGPTLGSRPSTSSGPTSVRTEGWPTGSSPPTGWRCSSTRRTSFVRWRSRPRTPARGSGAPACGASPTTSWPRRGTRSSSTSPASGRSSACRCSSRSRAPRRGWGTSCGRPPTPRRSSPRWPRRPTTPDLVRPGMAARPALRRAPGRSD